MLKVTSIEYFIWIISADWGNLLCKINQSWKYVWPSYMSNERSYSIKVGYTLRQQTTICFSFNQNINGKAYINLNKED